MTGEPVGSVGDELEPPEQLTVEIRRMEASAPALRKETPMTYGERPLQVRYPQGALDCRRTLALLMADDEGLSGAGDSALYCPA